MAATANAPIKATGFPTMSWHSRSVCGLSLEMAGRDAANTRLTHSGRRKTRRRSGPGHQAQTRIWCDWRPAAALGKSARRGRAPGKRCPLPRSALWRTLSLELIGVVSRRHRKACSSWPDSSSGRVASRGKRRAESKQEDRALSAGFLPRSGGTSPGRLTSDVHERSETGPALCQWKWELLGQNPRIGSEFAGGRDAGAYWPRSGNCTLP